MSGVNSPVVKFGWALQPSAAGDIFINNRDNLKKGDVGAVLDGTNFSVGNVEDKTLSVVDPQGERGQIESVFVKLTGTGLVDRGVTLLSVDLNNGNIYKNPLGAAEDSLIPMYDKDDNPVKLDPKDLKWLIKEIGPEKLDAEYAKQRISEIDKEISGE